jgi:hypothetical protein
VDNLDGMKLEGTTFWRDQDRARRRGMLEHSSYTSAERIEEAIEKYNIRREWNEGEEYGFQFNLDKRPYVDIAKENDSVFLPCNEFSVPFSRSYTRRFVYDPELHSYAAFNRDGSHIDEGVEREEDQQLHMANVMVQFVNMRIIPGDPDGCREVTTTGNGEGLLFTEGGYVPILWERESQTTPTQWHFANGQPIQLNPGATWICVLSKNTEVEMVDVEH